MKNVNDMLHNLFVDIGHTKLYIKYIVCIESYFISLLFSSTLIIYGYSKRQVLKFSIEYCTKVLELE